MGTTKHTIKNAAEKVGETTKEVSQEEYEKMARAAFSKSASIKKIANVSDKKVEAIYAQAYLLYNTGRYRDATELFRILITIDSSDVRFYAGFAACLHMLKEYDGAVGAYTLYSVMDPHNPIPHFHLSDCHLQREDFYSARAALTMAIQLAGDNVEYKTIKERCEITLQGLPTEAQILKDINADKKDLK